MFEYRPSPIVASAASAYKLPRIALLALLVAFILPGLFAREFWSSMELESFAVVMNMINGTAIDWVLPNINGVAQYDSAPLALWVAALTGKLFGSLIGIEAATRLSILFWYALSTAAIWYGTWYLARRKEAQPVTLVFGSSATPKAYGRVVADGALMMFIACFGLFIPLRELTPQIAMVAISATFTFSLTWSLTRPFFASVVSGAMCGLGVIAYDLWFGLALMIVALFVHWRVRAIQYPTAPRLMAILFTATAVFFVWPICAVAFAIETVDAWFLGWFNSQMAELTGPRWHSFGWYVKNLIWFLWPVWPFALACLHSYRKHLRRTHIYLPFLVVLAIIGWAIIAKNPDESFFMAVLPPMTMLAGVGLMAARRSWSSVLDWFSATLFTLMFLVIWAYYIAWHLGFPPKMFASVHRLAPMVEPHLHGLWLSFALIATMGWLVLIAWRISGVKAAWRGPWLASTGVTALAIIIVCLFQSLIDGNRSYRPVVEAITERTGNACIAGGMLNEVDRASLAYYGLNLGDNTCSYGLIRKNQAKKAHSEMRTWHHIDAYARPRENNPLYLLVR